VNPLPNSLLTHLYLPFKLFILPFQEQFVDQRAEEEEEVQDQPANGDIEHVEEATETKNTRAPVLKVDLSGIKGVVFSDSASVPQKTDFLEELNNREEEIRKMLYE